MLDEFAVLEWRPSKRWCNINAFVWHLTLDIFADQIQISTLGVGDANWMSISATTLVNSAPIKKLIRFNSNTPLERDLINCSQDCLLLLIGNVSLADMLGWIYWDRKRMWGWNVKVRFSRLNKLCMLRASEIKVLIICNKSQHSCGNPAVPSIMRLLQLGLLSVLYWINSSAYIKGCWSIFQFKCWEWNQWEQDISVVGISHFKRKASVGANFISNLFGNKIKDIN